MNSRTSTTDYKGNISHYKGNNSYTQLKYRQMNSCERSPYSTLDCSRGGYADLSGLTRLHVAVSRKKFNVVEDILAHRGIYSHFDTEIDEQNNEGDTALIMAVKTRAWSTVELLLSYGVNPNIQNRVGKTALHAAAEIRSFSIVGILVKHGVNLDTKDMNGNTALMLSVKSNADGSVEQLIKNGADFDIQNNEGKTALHMCSERNMLDMIKELMSHGANPNIRDMNGDIAENLTDLSAVKECIEEEARLYLIRTEHERLWFDM
jgi:ankyrin repeat protein